MKYACKLVEGSDECMSCRRGCQCPQVHGRCVSENRDKTNTNGHSVQALERFAQLRESRSL